MAIAPFVAIDSILTNMFLSKLLKLGSRNLGFKHQLRIQLAFVIPTLEMYIEKNIHNCIQSWIEKRTISNHQIADRASDSLKDITSLDEHHPLHIALKPHRPTTASQPPYKLTDWSQMDETSRGRTPNPVDRHLRAAATTQTPKLPICIEEPDLNGELREAAIRWSVYRFPVKYTLNTQQNASLELIPKW